MGADNLAMFVLSRLPTQLRWGVIEDERGKKTASVSVKQLS